MHVCPKQSGERKNKSGVWGRRREILLQQPPSPPLPRMSGASGIFITSAVKTIQLWITVLAALYPGAEKGDFLSQKKKLN